MGRRPLEIAPTSKMGDPKCLCSREREDQLDNPDVEVYAGCSPCGAEIDWLTAFKFQALEVRHYQAPVDRAVNLAIQDCRAWPIRRFLFPNFHYPLFVTMIGRKFLLVPVQLKLESEYKYKNFIYRN